MFTKTKDMKKKKSTWYVVGMTKLDWMGIHARDAIWYTNSIDVAKLAERLAKIYHNKLVEERKPDRDWILITLFWAFVIMVVLLIFWVRQEWLAVLTMITFVCLGTRFLLWAFEEDTSLRYETKDLIREHPPDDTCRLYGTQNNLNNDTVFFQMDSWAHDGSTTDEVVKKYSHKKAIAKLQEEIQSPQFGV